MTDATLASEEWWNSYQDIRGVRDDPVPEVLQPEDFGIEAIK